MCEKIVSGKIWACGDSEDEDVKFESCGDMTKPGHTVKITTLGSKGVGEKCGKSGCRNP
jgi:hypothetical protein